MQIVQVDKNNTILEIDRALLKDVVEYLKKISKEKKSSFQYIDELGDIVIVENGIEYVIPSKNDIRLLSNLDNDSFIDESDLEEFLDV